VFHRYKAWLKTGSKGYRPADENGFLYLSSEVDLPRLALHRPVEVVSDLIEGFLSTGESTAFVKVCVQIDALLLADIWVRFDSILRSESTLRLEATRLIDLN
jgi:hypothetical protein